MAKIKTSELTAPALDWAVARCEGIGEEYLRQQAYFGEWTFNYSTDWAQGGPIIERLRIELIPQKGRHSEGKWFASHPSLLGKLSGPEGPTALIAAMRCYVASKLGDEVEIPEELV